jgi:hypothetical protein
MTLNTLCLPGMASRSHRLSLCRLSLCRAAHCLSLGATPTFAVMALLTAIHGGAMPGMICSATQDASPLSGMVPMYVLMSVFHVTPWLKLISGWRTGAHPIGFTH